MIAYYVARKYIKTGQCDRRLLVYDRSARNLDGVRVKTFKQPTLRHLLRQLAVEHLTSHVKRY
jgi:hypothetical protein